MTQRTEYRITEVHHDGRTYEWTGTAADIVAAANRFDNNSYHTMSRADIVAMHDVYMPEDLSNIMLANPNEDSFVIVTGNGPETGYEGYYTLADAPDELAWAIAVCGHDLQRYTVDPVAANA